MHVSKTNLTDLNASLEAFIVASNAYTRGHDAESAHDVRIEELAEKFSKSIKRLKPYTKTKAGEPIFENIKELHGIYVEIGTALYEFRNKNQRVDKNRELISVGLYPEEVLVPLLLVADFVFMGLEAMDADMKEKAQKAKNPSPQVEPTIIKIHQPEKHIEP